MAEFSNRKNKQRQEWNPHWLLKILYGIWYLAVAAVKVAAGAVATVVLIALVCMFVFVGILGNYLQAYSTTLRPYETRVYLWE